jgi:hypothetical protein
MIANIDIIGKRYAVQFVEGEGDYGECFSDQCRIEVRATQCHQQQADTLLHEAMHAVDHEMHCSMSEPQIRRMATGLLALLRQNPELVAFLVA